MKNWSVCPDDENRNSITSDPYERFQLEEAGARVKVKFTLRF